MWLHCVLDFRLFDFQIFFPTTERTECASEMGFSHNTHNYSIWSFLVAVSLETFIAMNEFRTFLTQCGTRICPTVSRNQVAMSLCRLSFVSTLSCVFFSSRLFIAFAHLQQPKSNFLFYFIFLLILQCTVALFSFVFRSFSNWPLAFGALVAATVEYPNRNWNRTKRKRRQLRLMCVQREDQLKRKRIFDLNVRSGTRSHHSMCGSRIPYARISLLLLI